MLQHSPTFFVSIFNGLACQKVRHNAVLACAESDFSNFKFEYLRENKYLRKTILACLSGDQMGSIMKKIEVKNLVTLPL